MRGPRDKKDEPPPGGRARERLRDWERARGLPEPPSVEEVAETAGDAGCGDEEPREREREGP